MFNMTRFIFFLRVSATVSGGLDKTNFGFFGFFLMACETTGMEAWPFARCRLDMYPILFN